jgi:hypothetical protein
VRARVGSGKAKCAETLCVPAGFTKKNKCKRKDVTSSVNALLQTQLNKRINVLAAESAAIAEDTSIHNAKKIAKAQAKVAFRLVNSKIDSAVTTALNMCGKSSKQIQAILDNDLEKILTAQGSVNQNLELALDGIILGCPPPTCPPSGGSGGLTCPVGCQVCSNPQGTPFCWPDNTPCPLLGGSGGSGSGCGCNK